MKFETKNWSEDLQQQTRDAVSKIQLSPHDGKLHFKNYDSHYAVMTWQDLSSGKLCLTDKENGQVSKFADTEEMLVAGWAID